ncbi:UDP-glucose 6-dehydrogenase [Intrasporangium chromatireducens Q5-1]|uniref:UDP-glucose 6-dehydrogenase n=1 Tax=Intrasporangium chromatireducens Q5-1 TaxID=584657 RepID=W9GLF7_9MICO|nr:UDP-glucose/GDP-mannose dehydrogenase family protein [Intrasporangium chromatireducens]EWT05653.1 UDP-glucose 6-dehydrogenase [Intrasporangium chromatireducens Q5-1]
MRKISVIGAGYLGAVHAAVLASEGHEVTAVDTDAARVSGLSACDPPFYEPGLAQLLTQVLRTGRLRFTTNVEEVAACDVHFICVGTPQRHGALAAETSYLFGAATALAGVMHPESLVVGKSTVPVGTAARLASILQETLERPVRLMWNPEFLREGFAIHDTRHPDRLVYGVAEGGAEEDVALLDEVYGAQLDNGVVRLVMDWATAELVKVAANSFLATKISFINAMAEICEAVGGDVVKLADAIGRDDRIGQRFLSSGLGFGGGCLPKDIRAFRARAEELGTAHTLDFLAAVDDVNTRRRARVVELALKACGGALEGRRVAVLGAAFKPESDDIRDSPALDVAQQVRRLGAHVAVHDPKAAASAKAVAPELSYADSVVGACAGADVVLHLTEWQEYLRLDPSDLVRLVRRPNVIDARNRLDAARWRAAGWNYQALGRPSA